MDKKLTQFLHDAFVPYGDFPARADVTQELEANLLEKFNDLKTQGKSDDEAYQMTVDSFGDVSEIMEQVPHHDHATKHAHHHGDDTKLHKTILHGVREAAGNKPTAQASNLAQADLTDTDLSGKDFSMSALMDVKFDRSDLHDAKFKAAALSGASFVETNLTNVFFGHADLQNANFDQANLTDVQFNGSALKGVTFVGSTLVNTEFNKSDLSGISFEGMTLNGVIFNSSSLKKTSFKDAKLQNVTFHHSAVKHAIFDGATMDKLTYALLKGAKAMLTDVTVQ